MVVRSFSLLVMFVLVFSLPNLSFGMDPTQQLFENARQNELLRHYYRNSLLGTPTRPFDWRWPVRTSVGIERRVDQLIDRFTGEVLTGIKRISITLDEVKQQRKQLLKAGDADSRRKLLEELSELFDRLGDQAGDLHRDLSFPLLRLDSKSDMEREISEKWLISGFEREIQFIEAQFRASVEKMDAFFFRPSHTVQISDLDSGNMLVHLHRIKKVAEAVEDQIKDARSMGSAHISH